MSSFPVYPHSFFFSSAEQEIWYSILLWSLCSSNPVCIPFQLVQPQLARQREKQKSSPLCKHWSATITDSVIIISVNTLLLTHYYFHQKCKTQHHTKIWRKWMLSQPEPWLTHCTEEKSQKENMFSFEHFILDLVEYYNTAFPEALEASWKFSSLRVVKSCCLPFRLFINITL